jgi:hypothetical protein
MKVLRQKPLHTVALKECVEQLILIYAQPNPMAVKKLHANIKLVFLMKRLDSVTHQQLTGRFEKSKDETFEGVWIPLCAKYLMSRLGLKDCVSKKERFFSPMILEVLSESETFSDLINKLHRMVLAKQKSPARTEGLKYLGTLQQVLKPNVEQLVYDPVAIQARTNVMRSKTI